MLGVNMSLTMVFVSAGIVGISVLIGVASTKYFKLKDDNKIEEICEKIVKDKTGIDVDFTPKTKEEDKGKK